MRTRLHLDLVPQDRREWIALGATVVGGLLAVAVVVLLWEGARAAVLLSRASEQASSLARLVAAGDVEASRTTLDRLQDSAGRAHDSTDGPLWAAASWVPILGDDVDAVRLVTREVDRVASEALDPVVEIADQVQLDAFSPQDGRIDLDNLRQAAPNVLESSAVLRASEAQIRTIDTSRLLGRLRAPISRLQETFASTAVAARAADVAAELLPQMLGGEGVQRYLLLIQNNAELRSLGGIPGSYAVLEARNGKVSMEEQGSAVDIGVRTSPAIPIPDDRRSALPSAIALDLRDTTIDPDFPSAARFASAIVGDKLDVQFDGVVSVDPITLSSLLRGIGPVILEDGTLLTADNAVDELLNGVYRRYIDDPEGQDDVFEDAARKIFDQFVAGDGSTQIVLEALVQSAFENRILLWSAQDAPQERIARTGVAGLLAQERDETHVGVYLSDAISSKLQYYLRAASTVRSLRCVDDDAQVLQLRTTLTSDLAPGSRLPQSVTGPSEEGRASGQTVNVRIAAPAGGTIDDVLVDGDPITVVGGQLGNRRLAVFPVSVAAGQTVTVNATFQSGPGQVKDPVLTTTPGIQRTNNDVTSRSACR